MPLLMARPTKPVINATPTQNGGEVLLLRPVLDITSDTPQYYVYHAEVNFTVHEFTLSLGRMAARIRPEQAATFRESGVMPIPADLQILIPPSLVPGLMRALSSSRDQYEKQFGVELKEIVPGGGANE